MNQKEIKELIELLVEKDITEFELERGDMKLHVKRGATTASIVQVAPAMASMPPLAMPPASGHVAPLAHATTVPNAPASIQAAAAPADAADADLFIVKSPIVGTYYEAPSPGTPPFVKVGDTVKEGQVLCIIEAMKLMNEIESDHAGEVAKKFVTNGQPVEYGQPLFAIKAQ